MTNFGFRGSDSDHLINGLATNRTSASLQSLIAKHAHQFYAGLLKAAACSHIRDGMGLPKQRNSIHT